MCLAYQCTTLTCHLLLKAYIDQIVRLGRTFDMNDRGYQGLVNVEKSC